MPLHSLQYIPWKIWLTISAIAVVLSNVSDSTIQGINENVGRIIIVNTVAGSFLGIEESTGRELWKIQGPPLISQSLSDLRLVTQDSDYTLVPSLDGQLYLLEQSSNGKTKETSLKALPLTVDALFASNFMLTENSILTGGKDNSLFAFNPISGKVKYNCSRDGCIREPSVADTEASATTQEPTILVYCVNNIVRAVHIPTGMERWNLSIRQHDLCLVNDPFSITSTALQKQISTCPSSASQKNPDSGNTASRVPKQSGDRELEFGLDQLLIVARTKAPFSRLLWSYQLESRIAKAWIYSSDSGLLEPLQLFIPTRSVRAQPHQSDDTRAGFLAENLRDDQTRLSATVLEVNRKKTLRDFMLGWKMRIPTALHRDPECPSRDRLVYLGQVDGNLYVQLEDSADFPTPSRIALPRFSKAESPTPSVSTNAEHVADNGPGSHAKTMVGYYRATYSARPADEMCMQPFLSNQPSSETPSTIPTESEQRALVPWRPRPYMLDKLDDWLDNEPSETTPGSDTSSQSEAFSDWVYDSARDLFMLLHRAAELSDRSSMHSKRDSAPIFWWDNLGRTIPLGLLICIFYLTHRLLHLFNRSDDLNLAMLTQQSSATSLLPFSPESSANRRAYSTPNQTDSNIHEESSDSVTCEDQSERGGEHVVRARQRHSSTSCGTQAAPLFTSVYETDFKFVRCLGRGAFGRVFEVENRFDGHRYAVKRIEIKNAEEDEKRFFREVQALASLDHPGIVRYHRAWSEHPPPGWQEARDRVLFGSSVDDTGADTGCSWDKSIQMTSTGEPSGTGSMCNGRSQGLGNSSGFGTSPGWAEDLSNGSSQLFLNRQLEDSLIVFERNSNTKETPDEAVESKTNSSRTSISSSMPARMRSDRTTSISKSVITSSSWYLYIQMQLCSQMSLRDWLASKNHAASRPARTELYHMFWQLVDAVKYLHDNGFMHRDLKPSNILFDSTNRLKLADFGLVTSFADEDSGRGAGSSMPNGNSEHPMPVCTGSASESKGRGDSEHPSLSSDSGTGLPSNSPRCQYFGICGFGRHTDDVGTDLYMSPEQERRECYSPKVDIFSLGMIFLELLIPFKTNMERICTLLEAKRQILPEAFTVDHPLEDAFIKRLLDPNPDKRPSAASLSCDPLLRHAMVEQSYLLSTTPNNQQHSTV